MLTTQLCGARLTRVHYEPDPRIGGNSRIILNVYPQYRIHGKIELNMIKGAVA